MPEYRTYHIGIDNHFIGSTPMICDDDAEAIAQASGLANGRAIEVWRAGRLVKRLEAKKG
jgi:hypothetical protein